MREDWAAQATDTLDQVVVTIRDRTVVPARVATRGIVFGLLAGFFVATALILIVIAAFRGLVIVTGEVWAAYLIVGAVLVLAGIVCWARRSPRSDTLSS